MNIVNWLIWRARNFGNRFAATFTNRYSVMYSGTIVKMTYSNFKHDPSPLALILYSGIKYTHALNLNYLSNQEKQYLGRLIYALKSGKQVISGRVLYMILKRDVYYSIVRKCYRTYFSNRIMNSRMVSAGWTPMDRLVCPFNDPFITSLNRYLNGNFINYSNVNVSYSPQELQERIIAAVNSNNIGNSATRPATTPMQTSTIGLTIGTK